jgi:hypothetical protein
MKVVPLAAEFRGKVTTLTPELPPHFVPSGFLFRDSVLFGFVFLGYNNIKKIGTHIFCPFRLVIIKIRFNDYW